MTDDSMAALQRYFEGQYGKLELLNSRKNKRKRGQLEPEPQPEVALESEEEWHGLENDRVTTAPEATVFTFMENGGDVDEPPLATSRSFLV